MFNKYNSTVKRDIRKNMNVPLIFKKIIAQIIILCYNKLNIGLLYLFFIYEVKIMRILGIDPGYATIGYGVIDYDNFHFQTIAYGAVTTKPDKSFSDRLCDIFVDINTLIDNYKPDSLSIEKLYFNTNSTTAIDVAQARGVILLAARKAKINIYEYTPLQVKQSITGYGRAEIHQVMELVKNLLQLKSVPKPDDTADALAIAICHGHSSGSLYTKLTKGNV